MITPERVCKVLEGMCLLDMEFDSSFQDKVYMWCHIARGTCKNPHEDWKKEFLEVEHEVLEALKAPSQRCEKYYNPEFGDNRICECGHTYYRHFDPFENMSPVGCKYCHCYKFKEKSNDNNQGSE